MKNGMPIFIHDCNDTHGIGLGLHVLWRNMSCKASQFTTTQLFVEQAKHQSSALMALLGGESISHSQKVSNVKNVSMLWHHHGIGQTYIPSDLYCKLHQIPKLKCFLSPLSLLNPLNPSVLCSIHWIQALSRECRHCSNYIWVINNFIGN